MEYTIRSCVYNTTINNAMPVSVPRLPPAFYSHLQRPVSQPVGRMKRSEKYRQSEIHTSLAHAKRLQDGHYERDWHHCAVNHLKLSVNYSLPVFPSYLFTEQFLVSVSAGPQCSALGCLMFKRPPLQMLLRSFTGLWEHACAVALT